LTKTVGGEKTEGKYLKATSGWEDNGDGTDAYGFSALPGGFGRSGVIFLTDGTHGRWWSASERSSDFAYFRLMDYLYEYAKWEDEYKGYLHSVRCLQD